MDVKSKKFLIITLVLIYIMALSIRIAIIYIAPSGITQYYGMSTPIGEAARNLAEGRGYVIDKQYVDNILKLMLDRDTLLDIQDVPPPNDEKFSSYSGLPPGPSILMAITYKVFNDYRYIYLRILEAVIDSIGCIIMFLMGRELFNVKVGLIAASLYALWLPIAYIATWPLHDALVPVFTLVTLFFFIKAVLNNKIIYYVLTGLICGIGCYFQPSSLLLPIFFGAGVLVFSFHKANLWKQVISAVKVTAIMLGVMVLVISPWMIRNSVEIGSVTGMRPGFWVGLWENSGEFGDNPDGATLDDVAALELAKKELGHDVEYLSPEFDEVFRPKVINMIKDHTAWYLSLIVRRIPHAVFSSPQLGLHMLPIFKTDVVIWSSYLTSKSRYLFWEIQNGGLWKMIAKYPWGFLYTCLRGFFIYIPPVVSIIVFFTMGKDWRKYVLLTTIPLYFIAIHIVTMISSLKSIVPSHVGYIMFCAIAIYGICDWFSRRKHRFQPDVSKVAVV
ncbi:MAG: glycosyltransferase family 39 protein [Dehalococcoidia bacterium]|nr:glycosyltransferase family 39 protein [Dehalococcoidia bacterium]MDD5493729.1 glycosyltransferase family 39 protein [Dehalococcoidia bacterium]